MSSIDSVADLRSMRINKKTIKYIVKVTIQEQTEHNSKT